MLNWYKNLYIGDNAKKKPKKLIHKINQGAGVIDVYVITLAVIGLAKGYEEALEIIEQIVNEVYQETGTAEIRTWLEARIEKDGRKKKRSRT